MHLGVLHGQAAVGHRLASHLDGLACDIAVAGIGEGNLKGRRLVLAHVHGAPCQMIASSPFFLELNEESAVHAVFGNQEGALDASELIGNQRQRVNRFTVAVSEDGFNRLASQHRASLLGRVVDNGCPLDGLARTVNAQVGKYLSGIVAVAAALKD